MDVTTSVRRDGFSLFRWFRRHVGVIGFVMGGRGGSLSGLSGQRFLLGASFPLFGPQKFSSTLELLQAFLVFFLLFNAVCFFSGVVQAAGAVVHLSVLAWEFRPPFLCRKRLDVVKQPGN